MPRPSRPRPRLRLRLETLEPRETPAAMTGKVLTFLDADGDTATVTLSRALPSGVSADDVFHFDTGGASDGIATPQQLQQIDLTALGVNGVSVTAKVVKKGALGDGRVHVGWVNGNGLDLGTVKVNGDLGRVVAGNDNPKTPGLAALNVGSLGQFGTDTQGGGGTLETAVTGTLGSVKVTGDVVGAITVTDGGIGSVSVGSLRGDLGGPGSIRAAKSIGPVTVKGSLLGGNEAFSASIVAELGNLGPVTVTGDVIGGSGPGSAMIQANGYVETITTYPPYDPYDPYPPAPTTTYRRTGGRIASVQVGGFIQGGSGDSSAAIGAIGAGDIGPVRVAGDLTGGTGIDSAAVTAEVMVIEREGKRSKRFGGAIASVSVGGSVTGDGIGSAAVTAGRSIGPVTVGALVGGAGPGSAAITAQRGNLGAVLVTGDLVGGAGPGSAVISATGEVETIVTYPPNPPYGGLYPDYPAPITKFIRTGGRIASVQVDGSIRGGSGDNSAAVQAKGAGDIGSVRVAGDLIAGTGFYSAAVTAEVMVIEREEKRSKRFGGAIASVSVGGSVIGDGDGSAAVTAGKGIGAITVGALIGGTGTGSAAITAQRGNLGAVIVTGDVVGGAGPGSAVISAFGDVETIVTYPPSPPYDPYDPYPGYPEPITTYRRTGGRIASVQVGGSIRGGSGDSSAAIQANGAGDIGPVQVAGDLTGGTAIDSAAVTAEVMVIEREGKRSKRFGGTIASVFVGGPVTGDGIGSAAVTAGRSIGPVTVGALVGVGPGSAAITAQFGNLGPVTVTGDVIGGSGSGSATIQANGYVESHTTYPPYDPYDPYPPEPITTHRRTGGRIASVLVGGSIRGGSGVSSAAIQANGAGDIGPVRVAGDLTGGTGLASASINADETYAELPSGRIRSFGGTIGKVRVVQSVIGVGDGTAAVTAGRSIGPVKVGALIGGPGINSAGVSAGRNGIASVHVTGYVTTDGSGHPVTVPGDIRGDGNSSAVISASGSIGAVTVAGDLVGGAGDGSAMINFLGGRIGAVTVAGDIIGGGGGGSASVTANSFGPIVVAGNVIGGAGFGSAAIVANWPDGDPDARPVPADGNIVSVTVRGTVTGNGPGSAAISADRNLGAVKVGALIGGDGDGSAAITALGGNLGPVTVTGDIRGGAGRGSAAIAAHPRDVGDDYNVVLVGGRVASVTVRGLVAGGTGAGSASLFGQDGIGQVKVTGSWTAADIVAGFAAGPDGFFGSDDDGGLTGAGTIAGIRIGGAIDGTAAGDNDNDSFAFLARKFGSLKVETTAIVLTPGPGNDDMALGTTGDFRLIEKP